MDVKVKFSPEFERNIRESFGDGGALQDYIDATILESIDPYLPFDQGELMRSGLLNTRIGHGELVWNTPYARYLYHGLLMIDPDTGSAWARKGIQKADVYPTCTIIPQSVGGSARVDFPYTIRLGGQPVFGTVAKDTAGVVTFTPEV